MIYLVTDTTADDTMLTWHWPSITTQDVTRLWGPDSLDGELGVTNLIQLDTGGATRQQTGGIGCGTSMPHKNYCCHEPSLITEPAPAQFTG